VAVLARGRVEGETAFAAEWIFTDRQGGVSTGDYAALNLGDHVGDDVDAVLANRARVAAELDAEALALVEQVHGRDVARVSTATAPPPEADAVITDVLDLPVAVLTADCVPVLLADLVGGQVAAVHAGWRGVVADVVGATLARLAAPGPVHAWVGPAICPGCYEVSEEVRAEVAGVVPEAFSQTRAGTPAVDVRAAVLAQLARHGIVGELVGGCTYEDPDLYSFRRDPVTGRQAAAIVLRARR
jgi:YfiH family protein